MDAPDNQEFVKSVHNATGQILSMIVQQMGVACLLIEGSAKKDCPAKLGQLRASITHDIKVTEQSITGMVGTNVEYAPYVHQGTGIYAEEGKGRKTPWVYKSQRTGKFYRTSGQKPQPFLRNAVMTNKFAIAQVLGGKWK